MEKETQEENPFGGFNLLDANSLAAPTKEVKKKEEETPADTTDKAEEALEAAKKEIDEIAKKKESKKEEATNEESEEEDNTSETETEEEIEEGSLKPFVSHLASKGLIDYEEGEDFDDTEEGLENLQRKTINNGINKWKSGYDEDTQKYLEFVENGGNPRDFHKIYYNENSFADVKLTDDEDMQKHVIREGLIQAGWESEEEINDEIALYEDAGKLESKAGVYLKKLQKLEGDNKELLVAAQKKYAEDEKQKAKADWDSFKKGLYDVDKIADFKFTPKMKDDLWDYMTKVIDKKTGVTAYQKDSQEKGPEARYIFAYLMKNNWDASKLEKELKNKVVSGVKKKLSNYTDSRNKLKSGESKPMDKDAAEGSSFAGFRKALNN